MFTGILAVIIFLSILILVHELGHFLAAKKFGLWVQEFGIGLPPRIWKKKIGETIYSINALPFGGFVKIYGENREDATQKTRIHPNSDEFVPQFIQDDPEPVERVVISGRSFSSLPIYKRSIILSAGVLMNFLLGWLVLSMILSIGVPPGVFVAEVTKDSPASEVGLQVGDKISKINNLSLFSEISGEILNTEQFIKLVDEFQGREISLEVERGGKIINFQVVPRIEPPAEQGPLGIALVETGLEKQNFFISIIKGFWASLNVIKMVFVAIFSLIIKAFLGEGSLEQIAGPVGIVKITAQVGQLGFIYFLQFLVLISLNLVALNIFPFPALDGGRLLFLLVEKIKGSPLPLKFERYSNALGMVLLLTLMIAITIKDIIRFF